MHWAAGDGEEGKKEVKKATFPTLFKMIAAHFLLHDYYCSIDHQF